VQPALSVPGEVGSVSRESEQSDYLTGYFGVTLDDEDAFRALPVADGCARAWERLCDDHGVRPPLEVRHVDATATSAIKGVLDEYVHILVQVR
jgi:hypothetical protein